MSEPMKFPQQVPQKGFEIAFDILQRGSRPVVPISGAFGGINAQGQIIAHLYIEYPDIPPEASLFVSEPTGQVIKQNLGGRPNRYSREVVATIAMPPEIAASLGTWLSDQAKRASDVQSQKISP